jgi:hypothetical protein
MGSSVKCWEEKVTGVRDTDEEDWEPNRGVCPGCDDDEGEKGNYP